jgi:hypothetical protein
VTITLAAVYADGWDGLADRPVVAWEMARFLDAPVMPHPLAATFGNFVAERIYRGRVEALGSRRPVGDVPAIVDNAPPRRRDPEVGPRPHGAWMPSPEAEPQSDDTPLDDAAEQGPEPSPSQAG